jgi:hypothetical protein
MRGSSPRMTTVSDATPVVYINTSIRCGISGMSAGGIG